jgi:Tol biopolymer transport system component
VFVAPTPPRLRRVRVAGGHAPERVDLAGVAGYPAVSTGGARLAFVRRGMNQEIYRLQEGHGPEPVFSSTSNEQDAMYSPDGSKIAFATDRGAEGTEILVAHTTDPSTRRSLTKGARRPEGSPRWSPNDGRRITFDGLGDDGRRHGVRR